MAAISREEPRRYKGRSPDCAVLTVTFDQEILPLLMVYCPPRKKAVGKFLGRLVLEHRAREEERERVRTERAAVMDGG